MKKTKSCFVNSLKFILKINCFYFLLLISVAQIVRNSSLAASATYTTAILDDGENDSPFIDAIKRKDIAAIKSLVHSGYDVNEKTRGYTPLMAAVFKGNIKIVKLLISSGADLEAYDNQGNTPFMYAFYGPKQKSALVAFLLSLNVNAEIMNRQEQTPLILATLNNHYNSMRLLIKSGVNIEAKGASGGTALTHAADNENTESAKLLIKYGANLEARNKWSFTPLMFSALRNDGSTMRVLIEAGADIHARTTRSIPIGLEKYWGDFHPEIVHIPSDSSALDIARQFENRFVENILIQKL